MADLYLGLFASERGGEGRAGHEGGGDVLLATYYLLPAREVARVEPGTREVATCYLLLTTYYLRERWRGWSRGRGMWRCATYYFLLTTCASGGERGAGYAAGGYVLIINFVLAHV